MRDVRGIREDEQKQTKPSLVAVRTGGLIKGRTEEGCGNLRQNLPYPLLGKEGNVTVSIDRTSGTDPPLSKGRMKEGFGNPVKTCL